MSASTPSTAPEADPTATVVAVGLIQRSEDGHVLLAQRPLDRPHGGCWEFPGGKVEPGEAIAEALRRELREEIGIEVLEAQPWRRICWTYPKGAVRLEVWRVQRWQGEARGMEGQRIAWESVARLPELPFPAANRGIVNALRLPDQLLVTPEPPSPQDRAAVERWLVRLDTSLEAGVRMLQFRARVLLGQPEFWREIGRRVVARAHAHGARVLANAPAEEALRIGADGVHLSARALMQLHERPLPSDAWVSAACHDASELARAVACNIDFALLGPVEATPTHPGVEGMGWARAGELTGGTALPVFLIGGMEPGKLNQASAIGAQGIAAIRGLWRP
jgi:8-oxo-dGTP diphosphatase